MGLLDRLSRRSSLRDAQESGTVPNAEQSKVQKDQNRSNDMSDTQTGLPVDGDGFTDPGPAGYPDDAEPGTTPDGTIEHVFDAGDEVAAPEGEDPESSPEADPDAGVSTEAPEITDGTDAAGTEAKAERRPRGWLAQDVKQVLDKCITGELSLEEGKALTPHRVARLVQVMDGLDKAPSTGAVAAVFKRWEEYGFATFSEKPYAFIDYTDQGRSVGLKGLIQARTDVRRAEREAAKAAATPAPEDNTQDGQ
jgi:hypothetical protein